MPGSENMHVPKRFTMSSPFPETVPLCRIAHLCIGYGTGRRHTGGVAFHLEGTLPPSTVTALIGANGTGKSTLLRTIAGLLPPLSGHVLLNGIPSTDISKHHRARSVAFVMTSKADAPYLTAQTVIETGRIPYTPISGKLSAHDHHCIREAMALTRTEALAHRTMSTLSDGERQRVMIARALAQDTPLLLLDEPTAFLDFSTKIEILNLLGSLAHEQGKTILLSTHDVELSLRTVDRLWLLSRHQEMQACTASSNDPSDEGRQGQLVEGDVRTLAADGTLERYFSTQGLSFNAELMRFRLQDCTR